MSCDFLQQGRIRRIAPGKVDHPPLPEVEHQEEKQDQSQDDEQEHLHRLRKISLRKSLTACKTSPGFPPEVWQLQLLAFLTTQDGDVTVH